MAKHSNHVIGTQFPNCTRVEVVKGDEHLTLWNKAIEKRSCTKDGAVPNINVM
jgi:hypothetical protein